MPTTLQSALTGAYRRGSKAAPYYSPADVSAGGAGTYDAVKSMFGGNPSTPSVGGTPGADVTHAANAMYGGGTQPDGGGPASSGNDLYDALLGVLGGWHQGAVPDWATANKDKLIGLGQAASGVWGHDTILNMLNRGDWQSNYAIQIARSMLGLGPGVLNRHDPTHAGLMYVPGYGHGGEFTVPEDVHGLWTDPATGQQYYVY